MNNVKSKLFQEIKEALCDNYCLYSDTANENSECNATRNGGICQLSKLGALLFTDSKEVLHV